MAQGMIEVIDRIDTHCSGCGERWCICNEPARCEHCDKVLKDTRFPYCSTRCERLAEGE